MSAYLELDLEGLPLSIVFEFGLKLTVLLSISGQSKYMLLSNHSIRRFATTYMRRKLISTVHMLSETNFPHPSTVHLLNVTNVTCCSSSE